LSEYGTDLGGQILLTIIFLNLISNILNKENIEKIYFNLILLLIIFSFKVYFIFYFLIIPITFYFLKINPFLKKNFNLKLFFCFIIFGVLFFLHNVINTGCLIYPVSFTCFGDSLSWSLDIKEIKRMDLWLETWAKAGAAPNYRVENIENYVKGINWVINWIDNYFFTKVSDFLLIIFLINLIIYLLYKKEIQIDYKSFSITKKILIPLIILVLFFWFFKHPSLRYGGYLPISLIVIFIFALIYKRDKNQNIKKNIYFKTKVLIILALVVFNFKNITRINKEINREGQYKFSNFPFYSIKEKKYQKFKLDDENYLFITDGYCWATPTPCANTPRKGVSTNGYLFLKR